MGKKLSLFDDSGKTEKMKYAIRVVVRSKEKKQTNPKLLRK